MTDIKTFDELDARLAEIASPGIVPGLSRIARLLARLGEPQKRFRAVQVLGTNGKGSTAATIESLLAASGARVALYTSPHLVSLAERLRVRGSYLPLGAWLSALDRAERAIEGDAELRESPPTVFEILTAMAFLLTAEAGIDVAVYEAGMGGRYDATSLCEQLASVITPIGMDHTAYLGSTIEAIASEKFAAVRGGAPAFYAGDDESLIPLFEKFCRDAGAEPHLLRDAAPRGVRVSLGGTSFVMHGVGELRTPLIGPHQAENCARAVEVVRSLVSLGLLPQSCNIDGDVIARGTASVDWPGRFEVVRPDDGAAPFALDGAHNAHGMAALLRTVRALDAQGDRLGAVAFAIMKDKDAAPVFSALRELGAPIFCTAPDGPRAMRPLALAEAARAAGLDVAGAYDDPTEALDAARRATPKGGYALCCGSLYLVGAIRAALSL